MADSSTQRLESSPVRVDVSGINEEQSFIEKVGDTVTTSSRTKYDINVIRFPETLGTDPSLQHYVSFAINIRGKSKYTIDSDRLFTITREPGASLTPEEISAAGKGLTTIAGAALGGVLGNKLGAAIVDKIKNRAAASGNKTLANAIAKKAVDVAAKTGGTVAGAAAGGAIAYGVINSLDLLKPDVSYRISDVIALHLEEKPSVKYSATYANKDLGTLAGVIGQTGSNDLSGALSKATEMSGEVAAAAVMGLAKLPSMFGGTDVKAVLSAGTKTAMNPFREVLFEAIDFRTFNFKYRLMPKNERESKEIYNIIRLFKFHMHPELSKNRLFFIYPAEFQITYFFRNRENKYFHRFAPCVLTDMQVDYGGEQFSSFKDGAPGEVNLTLTFRETEILTKEKIIQGY